jgi:hypothetical protein
MGAIALTKKAVAAEVMGRMNPAECGLDSLAVKGFDPTWPKHVKASMRKGTTKTNRFMSFP